MSYYLLVTDESRITNQIIAAALGFDQPIIVVVGNYSIMYDNCCSVCGGKYWQCSEEMCEGRCLATGDSHYVTFDGTAYTFDATCTYTLLKHRDAGLFFN